MVVLGDFVSAIQPKHSGLLQPLLQFRYCNALVIVVQILVILLTFLVANDKLKMFVELSLAVPQASLRDRPYKLAGTRVASSHDGADEPRIDTPRY
jgi:hypothetical protein